MVTHTSRPMRHSTTSNVFHTCSTILKTMTLTNFDTTGHYVPQLAEVVYERNKHLETYQHINLKGFIVSTFSNPSPFLLVPGFLSKISILEINLRAYV